MIVYFSGGPLNGICRQFEEDAPLVREGVQIVFDRTPQFRAPVKVVPRRGQYVRVGDLGLWWGWDGSRLEEGD